MNCVKDFTNDNRLKLGMSNELWAQNWLNTKSDHLCSFLGLSGTSIIIGPNTKERHPDMRCQRCGVWFEIRSARAGITMPYYSPTVPFWDGKPKNTIIMHVRPGWERVIFVSILDLIKTLHLANRKFDSGREVEYWEWPWEAINQHTKLEIVCGGWF